MKGDARKGLQFFELPTGFDQRLFADIIAAIHRFPSAIS